MKILYGSLLSLILLFSQGCFSYKLIKNEMNPGSKYSQTQMQSDVLDHRSYNQFVAYARRLVVESGDISKKDKRKLAGFVDNLTYEDNKFLYFTMGHTMPFLENELNLQFRLKDAAGNNLLRSVSMIPIKHTMVSQRGSSVGYTYTWIVQCTKPIIKENIGRDSQPVEFTVLFPDRSRKVYHINL